MSISTPLESVLLPGTDEEIHFREIRSWKWGSISRKASSSRNAADSSLKRYKFVEE